MHILSVVVILAATGHAIAADASPKKTSMDALQAFNNLIGSWRCTGTPEGKRKEFWTETMAWQWQFKGDEAWLTVAFEKGKYFTGGELRYVPDKEHYQLTIETVDKTKFAFNGALKDPQVLPKMEANGIAAAPTTPEEFASLVKSEIARWERVIREKGITAE